MSNDILATARMVAAKYARRCWWADKDDLEQEAATVALHATRPGGPYDPDCGVDVGAYVWRACVLHLRAYLWRQSSPVSETGHMLSTLRGVHRAELSETSAITDVDAFVQFSEKEWTYAAHEQLDYLFDKAGHGKLVEQVLLHEEKPEHVASTHNVPVKELYQATKRAKRAISQNALLFNLMKDR